MTDDTYRYRVNALALIASAAFGGANMFIGTSMGVYWLSLDPLDFMNSFGSQFQRFLFTIMPLFLLMLVGIVLSARLDWQRQSVRRSWVVAIGLYVVLSLITVGFHMPENLRLIAAEYTSEQADAARSYWLLGHVPRVILGFLIPWYVFKAITAHWSPEPQNA
ncbi:MAG: anthrone oxygenase family protein [Pseudomonadota bacterium]